MRNVNEIAKEIREMDTWDMELLRELCEMAGMLDEWKKSRWRNF